MLDIRIAKPCNQTWTAMKGDDQVRHCGACRKNVYNISEMTEAEVEALVHRTEGRFCARVYRRTDGRILTADCPRGVAAVRRKRTLAVTGVFAAFAGALVTMPTMGNRNVQVQVGGLKAAPTEKIFGLHEEPMMGIIVMPERELGQVSVPSSRQGGYIVTMGAPMVAQSGAIKDRTQSGTDE